MKPQLKIGPLTQLQDARSSAAVGFDWLSFSLERGNPKKLSPSLIWNIIQWVSGPEIMIELDAASYMEWEEVQTLFPAKAACVPWSERENEWKGIKELCFLCGSQIPPVSLMQQEIEKRKEGNQTIRFELSLSSVDELESLSEILPHAFIHFRQTTALKQYLEGSYPQLYGLSLRAEMEEEPGLLNYELIDDVIELYQDRFMVDE